MKHSSFGKRPWEKNQNALCSQLGWSAELDNWNSPPLGRTLRRESNALCSKFGWKAELDKGKNPPGGRGTVRKESERTLFEIGFKGCNRQVRQSSCGKGLWEKNQNATLFQMGLNYWTRQVKLSSCGKGPWEKKQNTLSSKWGRADELDKANNLAVGRDPHKRIRSHFVPNGLELLITRQVKLSICGKGSRDKNQNAVCSKWGWTAELD